MSIITILELITASIFIMAILIDRVQDAKMRKSMVKVPSKVNRIRR